MDTDTKILLCSQKFEIQRVYGKRIKRKILKKEDKVLTKVLSTPTMYVETMWNECGNIKHNHMRSLLA